MMLIQFNYPEKPFRKDLVIEKDNVIQIAVHDWGVLEGNVDSLSQDYISMRDVKVVHSLNPDEFIAFNRSPIIFYNEEIADIIILKNAMEVV